MKLTVVIPTFKRPPDLLRCLDGLDAQRRLPDEVIVVCRQEDGETLELLARWLKQPSPYRKKQVVVRLPGVIQAMSAGVREASGDIVAFMDDDAVPWPDWVERLMPHYDAPEIGGVGGRDVMEGAPAPAKRVVGRVTWYGKLIGHHDQGYGSPREADVLKGVNMSFRRNLIRFPQFMRGAGAQAHFEVYVCLSIRRMGYKLIYDPGLMVDHYPAQRHDIDQRNAVVHEAVANASFNLSAALLYGMPAYRRPVRVAYAFLVGDRRTPGLLRFLYGVLRRDRTVVRSFLPAQKGVLEGLLHVIRRESTPSSARLDAKGGRQS